MTVHSYIYWEITKTSLCTIHLRKKILQQVTTLKILSVFQLKTLQYLLFTVISTAFLSNFWHTYFRSRKMVELGGHTMLCRRFRVCVYEEFFFVFLHKMCRLKKVIPLAMKMLAPNSEYSQCKNGRASGCQLTRTDCILFVNKAGQQNVKDNDAFHIWECVISRHSRRAVSRKCVSGRGNRV